MDQLKPIIKHHYWICFGLAVIFITVGWSLAIGKLADATKARLDKVEAAFSTAGQGGDKPNKNWIAAAKKVNEGDREAYNDSSRALWQRQKDARIWHNALQEEMKNVPFNDTITLASTRRKWGANYGEQFDELLAIVQPFNMKDGTGLVVVDKRRITHKNYDSWKYKAPTSEEIWKNQEDIWLLKSLLTSLARVNEGAGRITEASLREIVALRLRGGDREFKPSSGGGGMGGFGGMGMGMGGMGMGGGDAGEMSDAAMGGMGMGMNSGVGGGPQSTGPWKAFEGSVNMDLLGEEFGPVGGGAMMGGMDEDGGGAAGAMAPGAMNSFGSMGMGGFGGGFGAAAATETKRYVDEAEGGEGYKTRAFFLHVKVKEDQIPRLLAELTDSDFPVEIVRVDLKTFGGRSSPAGGMGGMYSGGGAGDPAMAMGGMGGMGMGMGGDPYAGGMGMGDAMDAMDDLGGAMMTPGMGMGLGDDPAMTMGDAGYAPPGVGGEYGDMPYGSGGYGSGGYGMPGMGQEQQTGRQALAAAMSDPMLVDLRVAGLMTLYQSQEETVAEEATEAAAAQEAVSDPGTPAPPEGATEATPDAAAPASETPAVDPAAPAGEVPAADPANPDVPAADPAGDAAPAAQGSETGAATPDAGDAAVGGEPPAAAPAGNGGTENPPN